MTQSQSLVEFLSGLLRDGGRRAEFAADPGAALERIGLSDASPQSIYEALVLIGDNQDLGRGNDVLNVPPPPPPAYFAEHTGDGAGARYLDNYVSGIDDDLGPFTGSSDAHGIEPGPDLDGISPAYDDGPDLDGPDLDGPGHGGRHGDFGSDAV